MASHPVNKAVGKAIKPKQIKRTSTPKANKPASRRVTTGNLNKRVVGDFTAGTRNNERRLAMPFLRLVARSLSDNYVISPLGKNATWNGAAWIVTFYVSMKNGIPRGRKRGYCYVYSPNGRVGNVYVPGGF